MATDPSPEQPGQAAQRARFDLFLVSVIILFLELACIRWFPAHVLYLTFFTNMVLLACFLGMSVGCLAAKRERNYLTWTPALLGLAVASALFIEAMQGELSKVVDANQGKAQVVYFGAEEHQHDLGEFVLPVEVLGGAFFLLLALVMVGPGQELGRALNRVPNRVAGYTLNILGSLVGIVLFAACSWLQLPPIYWFLPVAAGVCYLLARYVPRGRVVWAGAIFALVLLATSMRSGTTRVGDGPPTEHFWSPYYRIDFEHAPKRNVTVNQLSHQVMMSREGTNPEYALPHLLNRDTGGKPFEDVLIIGAGSGNDLSRALQWGAKHVDAVEIDPAIQRLGREHHPDKPYSDPRVNPVNDDGRNFLRSTDRQYDLVVYALVDSLVLHSGYSNIRLESYLFTEQAFADVKRHLKPGGLFVTYNFFRQGWLVARIQQELETVFGERPLVMSLPYHETIDAADQEFRPFTMFIAGDPARVAQLRAAFAARPLYWLRADRAPAPDSPNGFAQEPPAGERNQEKLWHPYGLAKVNLPAEPLRPATDDWPFLYLREPLVPDLSLRGMGLMAALSLLLIFAFMPRGGAGEGPRVRFDARMFFLGAGFMLIETKAVVHMALLFGSTWMVNTVVFFAVLVMILAANLYVLAAKPARVWPYYVGLALSLALNALVPLDYFLGMSRATQVIGSCLLVFTPVLFAGVIFAVSFGRTRSPDRAFGFNIAGAILGGLAENASMLLGFQNLVLLALGFYALSLLSPREAVSAESA
jgi:SAM-dependent methyltransferase